jgi:hypothetical protein
MSAELTDEQVKASILEFLVKKGRWGVHYFPLETLVNWLGKKVRRNGKRVRKSVKDLIDESYILVHKRGGMVSLNPTRTKEIAEYVKRIR